MSVATTPIDQSQGARVTPVSPESRVVHEDPALASVDHVSRQVFPAVEERPVPDFEARVSLLSPALSDSGTTPLADAVATRALGGQAADGYRLEPEHREFNPEECLAQAKAPLWFKSQVGNGGIGRSVEMTKEAEEKDQKPESDEERQKDFDMTFARMKFELGLTKNDVVNYDISTHSMVIYDREGRLQGKYDLKDQGTSEGPNGPDQKGGGLKQLLSDFGTHLTDDQIKNLSSKLQGLNREMSKIIEPETGGKLAYVFEAGNKGNIQGMVPFIAKGAEAGKVLHEDNQRGFFVKTMQRLGLVDTDKKTWPRSDLHRLSPAGEAAFADIEKTVMLQNIIASNIERKRGDIQAQIQAITPQAPVLPNDQERDQIQAFEKEIQQLDRVESEITGLSPSDLAKVRDLNAKIQQLTPASPGVPSKSAQKLIKKYTKEIERLCSEDRRTNGVNPAVLHLMLMELNSSVTIPHQSIRELDGRMVQSQTTKPAKQFLTKMAEQSRPHYGVDKRDGHGADAARNNLVDGVAHRVATGFETTVQEERSSKLRRSPMPLDPNNPAHREVQQIGTNMGALVHDLASRTSTDPSSRRKTQFIEGRSESRFAQESRGLELLIAAVIFDGNTGIRGYEREGDAVQSVMQSSLTQYRAALPQLTPKLKAGMPLDQVTKAALAGENRRKKAAIAA